MKWLPLFVGVGLGVGLGIIYLTQSNHDEEEWAYVPSNAADWRDMGASNGLSGEHLFYDTPILQDELTLEEKKEQPANPANSLLSEEDLAALLEQEQGEVD